MTIIDNNRNIMKFLKNDNMLLLAILIVFLFFLLSNIQFPGVNSDEACDGLWASHIIRYYSPSGEKLEGIMRITLFNRKFPIMANNPYVGAVESYLLVPFFLLFGINVFSLRLMPIFVSACTVFFIYQLCKTWFDRRVALITILLTVTNLVFVMYSRVGLYREELFLIFFFWSGLYYFWRYRMEQKFFYLCLGFFLFGLGLDAKIMFLWYMAGMVIAGAILRKDIFPYLKLNIPKLSFGILAFFLGSFLIIFYNLKTGGATIKLMVNCLFNPIISHGVDNLLYQHNLVKRIGQLFAMLSGDIAEKGNWFGTGLAVPSDYLSAVIFISGFIFVLFLLFFKKGRYCPYLMPKVLFFYIIYVVTFLCSPFTLSAFSSGHMFILFPFPQIITAIFLCNLLYLFYNKRAIRFFIYFILLLVFLFNIGMIMRYHSAMKKNGGTGSFSTAVYELADYLYKNKIFNLCAVDWGFHYNIPFLTDSKVRPKNLSDFSKDDLTTEFRERLLRGGSFYLIAIAGDRDADAENGRFKLAAEIIKELNGSLTFKKTFFNLAGKPVYYLYEVH